MPELTSKLIEMHQRTVSDLHTRVNLLTEHNHVLEQVVKEAASLIGSVPDVDYIGTDPMEVKAWLERRHAWLARVEQESK